MPAYAGPLHGMVELKCLSDLSESPASDPTSYTVGLSGRVRARLAPVARRSWSCRIGIADPSDLGTLEELYWSHRGRAVWLVTESARAQNVLPPPLSVLDTARAVMVPDGWESADDLTVAGAMATVDGVAAASVLVSASGAVSSPVVPCLPGQPVTVSAYVATGGTVALVWVDAAEVETTAATSAAAAADGDRVTVSATPTTENACRLVVSGASFYARPQLTWTAAAV